MSSQSPKVPYEAPRPEERAFSPRPIGGVPIRFVPGSDAAATLSPSLTYEPYYGLKEKAFSLSADPRVLYKSPSHAPAFDELLMGIRRREGLIVLTGEIGTGKTTLIRSVLQHLDRRTFTAFVPDPFVSREDLLKVLLLDFGVMSVADLKTGSLAGASRPDLSYPLYEFLDSLVPLQAFAVLIIDEAQNLPLPLLEEIRILSDLEHREKLLQVVLVGQPELRANLKLPEMRQVDQRISVRCELSPLDLEQVGDYVEYRLNVAGEGECRVEFSDPAIAAVFQASGGVPRVINLICDRALQRGQAAEVSCIEPTQIEEAIAALGLDRPSPPAPIAPIRRRESEPRPSHESVDPEDRDDRPLSVLTRDSHPVNLQRQILSEFEAETNLRRGAARHVRRWGFAASLLLAASLAAVLAAFSYEYVTTYSSVGPPPLPTSPAWTNAAPPTGPRPPTAVATAGGGRGRVNAIVAAPQRGSRYAIQVASFQSRERAERLVDELLSAGYQARAVEFDGAGSLGPLLQVRVDGYRSFEDADRDLTRIRAIPGYDDARLLSN